MPKRISWHLKHADNAGTLAAAQKLEGRLGSHRFTRFLSNALSLLAQKLAAFVKSCFLWLFSKVAWERKRPFKDYFNFSWKKRLPGQAADWGESEKAFAARYSANNELHVARRNYLAARQFLKEVADAYEESDRLAVQTLVTHRRILTEMSYLHRKVPHEVRNERAQEVVKCIQKRCDALSTPRSADVVHVTSKEGNYACFSFPGGHRSHYVTYEAQYHPTSGRYFFIIHNRGDGSSDKELHGSLEIRTAEGTRYKRTSVKIEVSLEQLKDPEFLGNLYKKMWTAKTMSEGYKVIKKHLLKKDPISMRPLNIVMSPQETKCIHYEDRVNKCSQAIEEYAQKDHLTKQERELLRGARSQKKHLERRIKTLKAFLVSHDPAFHSLQTFGTCTESNSTSPEKSMASSSVRRELKLFTIDQLANELSDLVFLSKEQQIHRKFALAHYHERSVQLLHKIKAA